MILVIGDTILDKSVIYKSDKICPEAPVPILNFIEKKYFLGGAANVANNIHKIGGKVFLLSKVGNNKNSNKILQLIAKNRFEHKIYTSKNKTTVKTRIFKNGKLFTRIDSDTKISLSKSEKKKIEIFVSKNINKFTLLVISDYNKGLIERDLIYKIISIFRKEKKLVITNPKKKKISEYQGSDIIIPNIKEFNNFFKNKVSLKKKIVLIFKNLKTLKYLIITRASQSLIFKEKNQKIKYFKIKKIKPIDVTGASDTFIATLSVLLSKKQTIIKSIKKSILASKLVIQKKYTSSVTKKELNI